MQNWWNDYIGIPYAEKGRDRSGLDCWGLVRLVYKDQFDYELPSFVEDYESDNSPRISELIAIGKENWSKVTQPQVGDVILLRISGLFMHVGVVISPNEFLHVREGRDSVIERFDSPMWRHRVEGFYKYTEQTASTDLQLAVCPHPLKTYRIDEKIPAGLNIGQVVDFIQAQYPLAKEYNVNPSIILNGKILTKDDWHIVPIAGDLLQYRAVATGDSGGIFKAILSIAVVFAAAQFGPIIAGKLGITSSLGISLVQAGLSVVGSLLVNAIFPVRPPKAPKDPGTAKAQNLLQGGSNQANFYGAIPVVLGEARFTAPLGAAIYAESTTNESFLRLALVWGYGPLQVSDFRIGDTDLYTLEEVTIETLNGFDDTPEDRANFNTIYGKDVQQVAVNLQLSQNVSVERVVDELTTQLTVTLHYPQGLRRIVTEGKYGGDVSWVESRIDIEYRQLDNDTLAPIGSWYKIRTNDLFSTKTVTLTPAWYKYNTSRLSYLGTTNNPVYQYTKITVDKFNNIKVYKGSVSNTSTSNPTGALLTALQGGTYAYASASFVYIPVVPADETQLWDIIVYGNSIFSITDKRTSGTATVTGCDLTVSSLQATIASGTIVRPSDATVMIGGVGEQFVLRKDAFSYNVTTTVALGKYEVRVTKKSSDATEEPSYFIYSVVNLLSITAYNNTKPINPPKALAMSAIRVKATNQINGQLEGISANVQSICFDYTGKTVAATRTSNVVTATITAHGLSVGDRISLNNMSVSTFNGKFTIASVVDANTVTYNQTGADTSATGGYLWELRPTSNPASLFRHVLQHPANAQAVADSKIDLNELVVWHQYCETNNFAYDNVIVDQESLLEVLRDICAAGRSSPTLRDGIWTVITDKERTTIAQYFTPHNSWGFEAVRSLPKLPHAFRVQFKNKEKGFQPDERIVYNDGYSALNATLFEELTFPGVTSSDAVYKHARFHFAQLKLRPETYTLNADIEHLVCTRGDRVKVTHDVPLWGLGTGRIVSRPTTTSLVLDEQMPMDAGVQYTIRIRLADGSSITRTVASKVADGYYDEITLTTSVTTTEAAAGNLFMFGALSEESVDLLVQSIEPAENMSARITLVDYSPAVYDSDTEEIPAFDSQITLPPVLQQQKITVKPTISSIVSNESVLLVNSLGNYTVRMKVSYTNPKELPFIAKFIEAQIAPIDDATLDWEFSQVVPVKQGSLYFSDVIELQQYKVRLRYVTDDGRAGPWTTTSTHTIVGKTTKPTTVRSFAASVSENQVKLSWVANTELDIVGYEIRLADAGWGDETELWKGYATNLLVEPAASGVARTWYIKAVDANGLYSTTAASVTFIANALPIPATLTHVFADTSLTNATITLDWSDVNPQFGLSVYRVTYGAVTKEVKASTITLPADWIGSRTFDLYVIDTRGNVSAAKTLTVSKLAPNPVTGLRAQVIDNNVQLYWTNPAKTTLPIQDAIVKKGATYAGATVIGTKSGAFTTVQETRAGTYTYWVAVRDTDNNESTPVGVTAKVSDPPDFVFNAEYISTFGATKSSAINEQGGVLIPVKTTETWTQHYVNNSWTTPAQQIAAGYPIFIQPSAASGYYEETFDYGTVLGSSQVTIDYQGTTLDDVVTLRTDIAVSDDNVTFANSENVSSIFATNFRYVKVRFTVTSDTVGLYLLNNLSTVLDAKLINDAGTVSAVSTDTNGTIVNFNKEFIDIQSINVSPSGTTLLTPVYNFQDAVLIGTYSVTSNVATVNVTGHDLVAGQKVRLNFTSGTAPNRVYTVATTPTANQFTVSITTANTSGNISIYPEGFRVYLFNSSGTRVSGTVSWQVRGY